MKHLRFLSYLFVTVLCLSFASCSDDDSWEASDVVGDWTVTHIEGYYYDYDLRRNVNVNERYDEGEWTFTFDRDKTGYEDDGWDYWDFEWALMNGNRIILSGDYSTTRTFNILKLNRNRAIIEESGSDFYYRVEMKAYDYYWD